MSVPSFSAEQIFRDPQIFPYGFARSGEFTTQQAQLLEKHGNAYKALDAEERDPIDEMEQAFVFFCRGDKPAESLHERTWERYRKKIERTRVVVSL